MSAQQSKPPVVFISYAREDEDYKEDLVKQLNVLEAQGVISNWHDALLVAGEQWNDKIVAQLNASRIILLLISPDFLNSKYIHNVEMKRASERHRRGEVIVVPVLVRPVHSWKNVPFGELKLGALNALPARAKFISKWGNRDDAFANVAAGIQTVAEKLQEAAESKITPAAPPSSIPRPPTVGFVARRDRDGHDIVARLKEELAPHKNQVVALWGAGGVGKTTLASEAVRSMTEAFAQRIVWISADQRDNIPFSTFLDELAAHLGDEDLRRLALEQKLEAVRALISVAPTLIILDNFETITPEDQLQCMEFLAERARCTALITTRQKIDRAVSIPIAAMSTEEANDFLQRLIDQTQDPDIYAELDRNRLIGTAEANPLIIEWIVGQIDLANDPEEVLDELSHGEGDAAERVFNRSFNLQQMADGGRAVLLALSLFTPSATRSALAEVAGMDMNKVKDKKRFKKAQETLASLWLIKKTDAGQRLNVAGLTRELTKAHLSADPRDKIFRKRFMARFLKYAQANQNPTPEHLNALEEEKDNILSVMDVASDMKDWLSVIRLSDSVRHLLTIRGFWDEAIRRGWQALKAAHNLQDKDAIARFAHNTAITFHNRGEMEEARRLYNVSLEIKKSLGNQSGIANTLHQMATLAKNQGELEEARQLYDECLEIKKKLDDQRGIASTLHQIAILAQQQGELDEARRLYNQSFDISKRFGDQRVIASTQQALGSLTGNQGELREARQLFDESLEINKKLGDQRGIASSLLALGILAQGQGELVEAQQFYNESLDISKRLGNQLGIAGSLHQLGTVCLDEGNIEEAENLLNQSLAILRKLSHKQFIAECLESMGRLRTAQDSFAEAHELFNESLDMALPLGNKFRVASVKRSLGLLAEKENAIARAVELLREALSVFESLKSPKAEETRRDLERIERESA